MAGGCILHIHAQTPPRREWDAAPHWIPLMVLIAYNNIQNSNNGTAVNFKDYSDFTATLMFIYAASTPTAQGDIAERAIERLKCIN
jgi:hypothetical protein